MSTVEVKFFQESGGRCPVREWLLYLPKKISAKADTRIERLAQEGHRLRRPEADYLREGIYELRWRFQSVNYRMLYFFCGRKIVIVTNGFTKEKEVPRGEIALAILRKRIFMQNPDGHSYSRK